MTENALIIFRKSKGVEHLWKHFRLLKVSKKYSPIPGFQATCFPPLEVIKCVL